MSLKMTTSRVELTVKNNIAYVVFNCPQKMNALTMESFYQLDSIIKKLKRMRELRLVVLSATGDNFCSGLDVKAVSSKPTNILRLLFKWLPGNANLVQRVCIGWQQLSVPVIAQISGVCFGGGLQIALGADFRLVDSSSRFAIMETKWGLCPDMGASSILPKLISFDKALLLTHLATPIDANTALEYGLVTQICSDLTAETERLCQQLLAQSPDALAANKRLYQTSYGLFSRKALAKETRNQIRLLLGKNRVIATKRVLSDQDISYQTAKKW